MLDEHGRTQTRTEEVSRTRVRVNRITRLADDLALALAAPSIRIEAPVPGQPIVGVEVPNADTRIVALRGLIESEAFNQMAATGGLPIALGRDVTGNPVIADLTRMPHVLIAGATGSGKSVCINTIISSLLMQKSPEEVRLILVDPKRVELTNYGSAPHLAFSHVVTEPDEVVSVLGRCRRGDGPTLPAARGIQGAQHHRVQRLAVGGQATAVLGRGAGRVGRHDDGGCCRGRRADCAARSTGACGGHSPGHRDAATVSRCGHRSDQGKLPHPDRLCDDLADGRPRDHGSSRAEKLMGRGDMLYMSSDSIKPRRVQGAYVSDAEIERLIESWAAPTQGSDGARVTG